MFALKLDIARTDIGRTEVGHTATLAAFSVTKISMNFDDTSV
jgi:hypothetical protein